mmetsp:Transcript_37823/g.100663  ORF Transcript_37823/g.100663 Transcript_37823/m.100663 type:complete len:227 (-) Transcript_37823:39-719(-)
MRTSEDRPQCLNVHRRRLSRVYARPACATAEITGMSDTVFSPSWSSDNILDMGRPSQKNPLMDSWEYWSCPNVNSNLSPSFARSSLRFNINSVAFPAPSRQAGLINMEGASIPVMAGASRSSSHSIRLVKCLLNSAKQNCGMLSKFPCRMSLMGAPSFPKHPLACGVLLGACVERILGGFGARDGIGSVADDTLWGAEHSLLGTSLGEDDPSKSVGESPGARVVTV